MRNENRLRLILFVVLAVLNRCLFFRDQTTANPGQAAQLAHTHEMLLPPYKRLRVPALEFAEICVHLLPHLTSGSDLIIQHVDHIRLADIDGVLLQQLHLDEDIGDFILNVAIAKAAVGQAGQPAGTQPLVASHRNAVHLTVRPLLYPRVASAKEPVLGVRGEKDNKTKDDRNGYQAK